ncbi:MAG: hypothetical protein RIQ64_2144, partial [Actinomycetota bacterium]
DLFFGRAYLWTHDQNAWYLRLGWTKVEDRVFRGVSITIFHRDL